MGLLGAALALAMSRQKAVGYIADLCLREGPRCHVKYFPSIILRTGRMRPKRRDKMIPPLFGDGQDGARVPLSSHLPVGGGPGHTHAPRPREQESSLRCCCRDAKGQMLQPGNRGWEDGGTEPACERTQEPLSKLP